MIPSTLCALLAVLSSFTSVNGAVVQRDGTFTYLTPQPTVGGGVTTTTNSQMAGTTTTQSTQSATATTTSSATSPASTSTTSAAPTQSLPVTSTTSTTPTTPAASSTTPTTSATSTRSPTLSSSPTTPTTSITVIATIPTTSVTVTQSASTSSVPTTVPTTSSKTKTVVVTTVTSATSVTSSPSTTPTSAPGNVNCDGVQQWQADFAYTAGNKVIFNNQLFTALQWTYDNAPPAHPDQWALAGTCTQPIHNQANCNGVGAWQSNVAYTAGNKVTFGGHLWSATQWTQSNSPGDTSGSWQDLGACA